MLKKSPYNGPPVPAEEQAEFCKLSAFVMKVGAYKDRLICQVPLGHLRWLSKQHVAASTKRAVVRYIELSERCVWEDSFTCRACGMTSHGEYVGAYNKGQGHPECLDCGSQEITIVREPIRPKE